MTVRATCPICGEQATQGRHFPFCSARCQLVDLGRWLDGTYRIPGEPTSLSRVEHDDNEHDDNKDRQG